MTTDTREMGMLVMRVQDAFLKAGGLTLTISQAQQWFGLDWTTCTAVLHALAEAHVLMRTEDGGYTRFFPALDGFSSGNVRNIQGAGS